MSKGLSQKIFGSIYLKLFVSFGLIALILLKIDLGTLKENLLAADLKIYGFATGLFFLQQVVIAYSWQILLKAQENRVSFWNVLRVYFIGSFMGTFLPSSVGMDVVRIYGLAKHIKDGVDSASSMVVSRILGFLVLIAFALVAAIPMSRLMHESQIFLWIFLLSVLFLGTAVFVLSPLTQKILYFILEKIHLSRFNASIQAVYRSIYEFSQHKKALLQLTGVSVFFQLLGIYIVFLVGKSLNIPLSMTYYFLLIPIIMVITLIPISIAGIGVRESSFIYFFTQAGISSTQALSLSFLVFFQWILMALIGGLIYLLVGFQGAQVMEQH